MHQARVNMHVNMNLTWVIIHQTRVILTTRATVSQKPSTYEVQITINCLAVRSGNSKKFNLYIEYN